MFPLYIYLTYIRWWYYDGSFVCSLHLSILFICTYYPITEYRHAPTATQVILLSIVVDWTDIHLTGAEGVCLVIKIIHGCKQNKHRGKAESAFHLYHSRIKARTASKSMDKFGWMASLIRHTNGPCNATMCAMIYSVGICSGLVQ